jgi:hypothetical protein
MKTNPHDSIECLHSAHARRVEITCRIIGRDRKSVIPLMNKTQGTVVWVLIMATKSPREHRGGLSAPEGRVGIRIDAGNDGATK